MSRFFQYTGSLALGATLLLACEDPGKGKQAAQVGEAVTPVAAKEEARDDKVETTKYEISESDSKISFVGAKVSLKHDGSFPKFQGTVEVPGGNIENGKVELEIDLASVETDTEKLTGHLKSPDFFDVEKFPKSTFKSTSVKAGGADGATHTLTGNLDLHGVTKSISFPATIKVEGDTLKADAEFVLNRKDFGITYPGMPDDLINDNVAIKLAIVAKKTN